MSVFTTSPERQKALREHAARARNGRSDKPSDNPPTKAQASPPSNRQPYQPPPPQPQPRPAAQAKPRTPWDVRLVVWLFYRIHWNMSRYSKARSFVVAMFGGFVTPAIAEQRTAACMACPMRLQKNLLNYCDGCNCGQNMMSRLDRKRWFDAALCPKRRWKSLADVWPSPPNLF